MQRSNSLWVSHTLLLLNLGVGAFRISWRVGLIDGVDTKAVKNFSDVEFLGYLEDAGLRVSVDPRFKCPLNLAIIGDNHRLAQRVIQLCPERAPLLIA